MGRLDPDRYLVTTLWTDAAAHARYAAGHLPALRERAGVGADIESPSGGLLPLEPTWRVLPATGQAQFGQA
ncbi:hypothetical protein [Kitasatospora sp. NPDC093806]|uniref:hypothetical protein n=1 Tax=Kitasatospora sp. NPDC093806 TaxID=3155075 RepID=UPI00344288F3